jgi:hypothetical protein
VIPVKAGARVRELREKLNAAIADAADRFPLDTLVNGERPVRLELEDAKAIRNALVALEGAIDLGAFTVSAIGRYLKGG